MAHLASASELARELVARPNLQPVWARPPCKGSESGADVEESKKPVKWKSLSKESAESEAGWLWRSLLPFPSAKGNNQSRLLWKAPSSHLNSRQQRPTPLAFHAHCLSHHRRTSSLSRRITVRDRRQTDNYRRNLSHPRWTFVDSLVYVPRGN